MKSKVVALSAISAGFISILLTIGAYIEIADIFTIVLASCFVVLPLYYDSFRGAFLTYLVGGVIAFIFSGFNLYSIVFPSYFLFGGIYPIFALYFKEKKQKKLLVLIVGFIYSVAFFIGILWTIFSFYQSYLDNNDEIKETLKTTQQMSLKSVIWNDSIPLAERVSACDVYLSNGYNSLTKKHCEIILKEV